VAGALKPSSELPLHLAVYAARADVGAVVHTHSIFASACAAARRALPPVIEDLIQIAGGAVEVADYALPGTPELATNAVAALGDRQGALLANHGAVGCGRTADEALLACELIEKGAQIFIYANLLGGAQVLSDGDVAAMRRFYTEHYRRRQEGAE
jgi:L-fuculose-phosphate aldolase